MINPVTHFIESLAYYHETKAEHDAACGDCDSSWGYFGHEYIERLEEAERQLSEAFNAAVDARIRELSCEGDTRE